VAFENAFDKLVEIMEFEGKFFCTSLFPCLFIYFGALLAYYDLDLIIWPLFHFLCTFGGLDIVGKIVARGALNPF